MIEKRWLLPILLLCAILLRLQGLDWDEGRALHPDENNLVRAASALTFTDPIPAFHAYNDLALWLPKVAALPFCDVSSESCLRLSARVLSALFSGVAVWIMTVVAHHLAGRPAALATALLAGASAPLIQWAHFGTTESALIFLVACLWLQALRWMKGLATDKGMAFVTALLLGLGFGLKTSVLPMAIIPFLALVLSVPFRASRLRSAAWGVPLTVVLALCATPSLIFAPADWLSTMRFESGVVSGGIPVFWTRQFEGGSGPTYQLAQLWSGLAGSGAILALAGLLLAPVSARRLIVPGLGFAVIYAGLTFSWHAAFFRYLAPVFPVALVLAGIGAARMYIASGSATLRAVAGSGVLLVVINGLDFAAGYQSRDPRLLAEAFLAAQAKPESVIAIEPHDTPLAGQLATVVVPLESADAAEIGAQLARADWMLVASRRNWAVLPNVPQSAPLACQYYLALLRGQLGFRIVGRFTRVTPLGLLLAPGVSSEETRTVFDRPEVYVLRKEAALNPKALSDSIATPAMQEECSPESLGTLWSRPR